MPKTASIMGESSWREHYGWLLKEFSEKQEIRAPQIAQALDTLPGSSRNRLSDWSHYVKGDRIPTQSQLSRLAQVLRVPFNVLRLATGYVDEPLECCYAVANEPRASKWPHKVSRRRAAFGLLFSLFPCKGMHIDNRLTLRGLMQGNTLRLNLVRERGFLTGHQWNATWLYPKRFRPAALIYDKFSPNVQYIGVDPDTSELVELNLTEETYVPNVVIRAQAQIDVASPIASTILSREPAPIPRTSCLAEAQRILHVKTLPRAMRVKHATDIIHLWADGVDKRTAEEVREHLQQWNQRSLTQDAVRWIRREIAEKPDSIWLSDPTEVTLRRVRG
jgi:hypothetical protein